MALKEMAADLKNFKYGISSPDRLDGQIENGVDFFDNNEGGADGFTPKTDLESLYHKVRDGNVVPPNDGLRTNTINGRVVFGQNGEYEEAPGIGFTNLPLMRPFMGDTQLGPGVLSGFQPNYYANLLPIGFPTARSMWRTSGGGYRFITRGTIPPDNDLMQEEFKNYPPFDLNDQITLKNIDGFSITNQPGGIAYNSKFIGNANGSDFMITPIPGYSSNFNPPENNSLTFNVNQHTSTGPTQFEITNFDDTPSIPRYHKIAVENTDPNKTFDVTTMDDMIYGGYGLPVQRSSAGDAKIEIINDKRRGVFDKLVTTTFENQPIPVNQQPNTEFNPLYDRYFSENEGKSIHISPGGELKAGLRYNSPTFPDGVNNGISITDVVDPVWSDTFPLFSENFLNPLADHKSRFAILGDPSTVNPDHPVSLTWDLDTSDNVGFDRVGTLEGIADAWPAAVPTTNLDRIPQPEFAGTDGLTSFGGMVVITDGTAISTSNRLVIGKNTYTAPGIDGYNQTGYSESTVGETFTQYTFGDWKDTWSNSYKKDQLGSFVSAENLILLTAGGEDNILEKRGGGVDVFNKNIITIPDTYRISGDIRRYGKFDTKGVNEFMEVPAGLGQNNIPTFKTFREVADPGKQNHPLIQREIGNNWGKDTGLLTDNPLGEAIGGFVRGAPGITGLISRSFTDKLRIGRWLLGTSDGLAFGLKQFALQALNPTLESKIWNPASALTLVGAGDAFDAVRTAIGDTLGSDNHINIGEFASQVAQLAITAAFPIGQPERHLGGGRYEDVVPLTGLPDFMKTFLPSSIEPFANSLPYGTEKLGFGSRLAMQSNPEVIKETTVGAFGFEYTIGGKDLGTSLIFMNPNKYLFPISSAPKSVDKDGISFTGGIDLANTDANKIESIGGPKSPDGISRGGTFNKQTNVYEANDNGLVKRHSTLSYDKLRSEFGYDKFDIEQPTIPKEINDREFRNSDVNFSLGDARRRSKKINDSIGTALPFGSERSEEDLGVIKGDAKSPNVDKINITPVLSDLGEEPKTVNQAKDFIKFMFKDLINNKFIIFRAILDAVTDTITPEYGETKFLGRPDKVYNYSGTARDVSFGFKIYPKTKQELPVLMEKLNYLVSLCYPGYTETSLMISPFIELTIGDMFNKTPGLLSGLTVTVEEATTWEIEEGLQFPHFISCQCEFKYIGGTENVPTLAGKHYDISWLKGDHYGEGNDKGPTGIYTKNQQLTANTMKPLRNKFKYIDPIDNAIVTPAPPVGTETTAE